MTSRIWIMLVGITAVVAVAIGLTIAMPGQEQSIVRPATASAAASDVQAVVPQQNSTESVVESITVPAQLNQAGLPQGNGQGMGPGNGQGRGNGGQGQGQGRGNGGQGQGQGPGQGTGTCQSPNMVDTNNNGICDYREQP